MAQNPYSNPIMQGKPGMNGPALPGGSPGEYTGGVTQRPLAPKPRMTLEQSDMMRNANRNPYTPNNGNPRGANNMPGTRGYNPNQRIRGAEPDNRGFSQDSTGRMRALPGYDFESGQQRSYQRDNRFYAPGQQTPPSTMGGDDRMYAGGSPGWADPTGPEQNGGRGAYDFMSNPDQLRALYERFGSRFPALGGSGYQQGPSQGYMGGQQSNAGRYRPPMMNGNGDWQDYGGYNYNLPNAFGSYPGYGQGNPNSPYFDQGYSSYFGWPGGG